jgi:hypothetical protein
MQGEGEEAVGQVQLAVPAARMRSLDCIVDAAVVKIVVPEMVVQIAREVDNKAGHLALFDDDVEGLDAEIREVSGGGQFSNSAKVHVLTEASSHHRLMLMYGGSVGVGGDCGF